MNKFIISLLIIEYVIICAFGADVDELTTEPYHDFNWLDEDEYSISIGFKQDIGSQKITCCLFNGTIACRSSCDPSGKTLNCKFVGNECKADGDNPATKFYHSVLCGNNECETDSNAATALSSSANVYVTVAVSSESYVKYSILLLLSLLVL